MKWCYETHDGLRLIYPNAAIASAYLHKAREALVAMGAFVSRDWQLTAAYYAMYFGIYALLQRIGIVCRIHACTIDYVKTFLDEFSQEEIMIVEEALHARIDAQYYTDRPVSEERVQRILRHAPEFVTRCAILLSTMGEKRIADLRKRFPS